MKKKKIVNLIMDNDYICDSMANLMSVYFMH